MDDAVMLKSWAGLVVGCWSAAVDGRAVSLPGARCSGTNSSLLGAASFHGRFNGSNCATAARSVAGHSGHLPP